MSAWCLALTHPCFSYIMAKTSLIFNEIMMRSAFLDLYLEFDDSGQLSTKIINFPNMCSNIPASSAYGVYISRLIRYARASSNYSDILKRHLHLRNRLLTRAIKRFALFDLLKRLYSDTKILSKYIPSLQKRL